MKHVCFLQLQMLRSLSSKGVLVEYRFVDTYAGESKDGSYVAKFYTGDIIFLSVAVSTDGDLNDVSYANLAIFKDRFWKMEGAVSGVCLKSQNMPTVSCLYVWKSLQHCYSWILNSDSRKTTLPYLDRFKLDIKYDIFRVVYVSTETASSRHSDNSPALVLATRGETESEEQQQVMQIWQQIEFTILFCCKLMPMLCLCLEWFWHFMRQLINYWELLKFHIFFDVDIKNLLFVIS